MFNCIVHGWSSHEDMCPICSSQQTSTATTTDIVINPSAPGEDKSEYCKKRCEAAELLLDKASTLVGNPGVNISSSTDIACDNWQDEYEQLKHHSSKEVKE